MKRPLKRRRILQPNRSQFGLRQSKKSNQHGVKLPRNNPLGENLLKNSLLSGDGERVMKYLIKKRKLKVDGDYLPLMMMLLLHGLLQLSQLNNRKMNLSKLMKSLRQLIKRVLTRKNL